LLDILKWTINIYIKIYNKIKQEQAKAQSQDDSPEILGNYELSDSF